MFFRDKPCSRSNMLVTLWNFISSGEIGATEVTDAYKIRLLANIACINNRR